MNEVDSSRIPNEQTAALIYKQGEPIQFVDDYPVPKPGHNEVLAKVLYTGVCLTDLHHAAGTSAGADGKPITNLKFPHVGGHEGIGRIVALGTGVQSTDDDVCLGALVGIRYAHSVCHRCEFCLAGVEQYCPRLRNHLHTDDGSFQQYIVLDALYIALLPPDIDMPAVAPVLCAGVSAYKAVLNTEVKAGQWIAVVGAAGGLGHFAIQYARAEGARVIGVDAGSQKKGFILAMGAEAYIDIGSTPDPVPQVHALTGTGVHGVVVTAGVAPAFAHAAGMLRIGGTLSCVGIAENALIKTAVSTIVIKALKIVGNLGGNLKEGLDAVDFVHRGIVKPKITVRKFRELPQVYGELERGQIEGRVVLKIAEDE